jgi:oxygen-dependent protoporphyrinogen oxidase
MSGVIIVGGGISGLATAWHLSKHDIPCTVLEAGERCGGRIVTERVDDFLIEGGADSVLTQKPWAIDLCRELGLEDQLQPTRSERPRFFILHNSELMPMPDGMVLMIPTDAAAFRRSPLISDAGKERMLQERDIPCGPEQKDESLDAFITRRFGRECLETIAGPLLGAIYMTPPEKLSMRCAFPRFLDAEQKHGSLIRAMENRPSGDKPSSMFTTLAGGMGTMIDALVEQLGNRIKTGVTVSCLEAKDNGFTVHTNHGTETARAIVMACPAASAASICRSQLPTLAAELETINHVSTATVSLGFAPDQLRNSQIPDGTGFVVPAGEQRKIQACTWVSNKFAGRAAGDTVLLRAFMGGPDNGEWVMQTADEALIEIALDELRDIMGFSAASSITRVYRWPDAHPQYEVGHLERVERMEAAVRDAGDLYLCGWPYRGNGIPDCVRCAQETADRIKENL